MGAFAFAVFVSSAAPSLAERRPTIPANDGPPPVGYHVEERARTGWVIAGASLMGGGAILCGFGLWMAESHSVRKGTEWVLPAMGGAVFVTGVTLLVTGSEKRPYFVPDRVTLAPTTYPGGAGAALDVSF